MNTSSTVEPARVDYSYLDVPALKKQYSVDAQGTSLRVYIGGVRCEKCVRRLEGLVGAVPGLLRLRVEMGKNLAQIEVDPSRLTFSQIVGRIKDMGFEPIPLSQTDDATGAVAQENRRELIRLAVAGACAGNIMTFAFAMYLGGDVQIFSWLSLLLYLPVVSYVAWPFYLGAWNSLRQRQISIDLPMAVASFAGFLFSLVEMVRGGPNVYFDSLSGFLFLILVSRWVQRRLQRRYLDSEQLLQGLGLDRVRACSADGWGWESLTALTPGREFLLFAGETVPADAELLSDAVDASLAWLSGESLPKVFHAGASLPAGARILSREARFAMRVPLEQTEFGALMREVRSFSLSRNRTVLESDRWPQWFLASVFLVAVGFVALYWQVSPEQAVQRAIALIVLACPCAMAFGTPLALAVSLQKSGRAGMVVRDAGVFSALNSARTVFFDKTGTLTETDLSLVEAESIPVEIRRIVLALENQSLHPIAFAFRSAFGVFEALPVTERVETPGVGIKGRIDNHLYEIKSTGGESQEINCTLLRDSVRLRDFSFVSAYASGCRSALGRLRARGLRVVLLSGDSHVAVSHVAAELGFASGDWFAQTSPSEKARLVGSTPGAVMIGDGVNDSLALQNASVGIAATGGVGAAMKSAGVYLGEPGLSGLDLLFSLSREAQQAIRGNLQLSLVYNTVGGAAALMGYVNPLVAALLMPASSGAILLTTWLRGRR